MGEIPEIKKAIERALKSEPEFLNGKNLVVLNEKIT